MIYVSVKNLNQEIKQKATFETQELANAWIANQEAKTHTWRIKAGFRTEKIQDVEPAYEVQEETEFGTQTKYYYEQNYTIKIVENFDNLLQELRRLRNTAIQGLDYEINRAFDNELETLPALKVKRQALRDITENYNSSPDKLLNVDINILINNILKE